MPTTPAQRLAQVKRTKDLVNKGYYDAMANAKTKQEAQAIDEAYYAAELAFVRALKKGLESNGNNVENAVAALKSANDALQTAIKNAAAIANLLAKLTSAAKLALKLASMAAVI